MSIQITKDNGGRRYGMDRRSFSYTLHVPQRRSGKDRRSGFDRRKKEFMEKRTEPRKPYSGHIFFVTKDGFYEGSLKNYSSHGLFIATSISPPIGDIITVALPYLDGKADKCKGQIMWRNKAGFGIELFQGRNGSAQMYSKSQIKLNKQNARLLMHQ